MLIILISAVIGFTLCAIGATLFLRSKTWLVSEDTVAVTINKDGFVKRVLPAGRHLLHMFESVNITLETKTKLVVGQAGAIASKDGIPMNINWSGLYSLRPDSISENFSQKLRGLPQAEKAITRNIDIGLRKLVGSYAIPDLFNPATREQLERRLAQTVVDRLKPAGIAFKSLNLQAIELPREVTEALNKAKAIETLDGAIRQLDPTTREVVRGAYQLDEILHWDSYLPTPSRLTMKRIETIAQ